MKKNVTTLLAAMLLASGSQAQLAKAPTSVRVSSDAEMLQDIRLHSRNHTASEAARRVPAKAHAPLASKVAGPSADLKLIDSTPEGTETLMSKTGFSYGYSWFTGLISQSLDGALSNVVISNDSTRIYMQNPIFFNYSSESNWIEGTIENGIATFRFPQLIGYEAYYDDEGNIDEEYYDYALVCEFKADDEGSDEGWYYPSENQEYQFRIETDGTYTPLRPDDMIGFCAWFDEDEVSPGEEPYWSWQGNGDFIYSMGPITDKVVEVPDDVEFSDWQMITGISYRTIQIGVKDDKMYMKGMYAKMKDAAVVGQIVGDKVVLDNGQYLGPYYSNSTTAYFDTGVISDNRFEIKPTLEFDYDMEKSVLKSDGAYCVSSSPDKVIYYVMVKNPYICLPSDNYTVTSLYTPQLTTFYDIDEKWDYDAEFYFNIPTVDPDMNILDKDRLYYEVIMDSEVFVFYDDEYELPEGVSETTEVPYGYESDNYDFYASGNEHGFVFHTRGFENLGVRVVYRAPGEQPVYSEVLWAPGYEGSFGGSDSVSGIESGSTVKEIRYYDLNGMRVSRPAKGMYLKKTVMIDGSVNVTKSLAR